MAPTLKLAGIEEEKHGFVNAFEKDATRDIQYEDVVYLVFKPENIDKFREFLDNEYERTENIVEDYDYPGGYVVVIYKLDPNFKHDFDLVRKSKYSKTSKEFQFLFPTSVKIMVNGLHRDQLSLQHRVFRKAEDLRLFQEDRTGFTFTENMEVWSEYDPEEETLNINKIQ